MNNLEPQPKDAMDKEKQPSIVALEDSFSEIAKVMQDDGGETQESMKAEEGKDNMPKLKRGQKYSVKDLLKAQDADKFVASGEDVVGRQRSEVSGIPQKCCSSCKEILERPKEPNISQCSGSFVLPKEEL